MEQKTIRLMCRTAVLAAVIFVFTAYLHVPSFNGYTHVGDGFLFLAASILPPGYAVAAGVIGEGLADLLSGYAMWCPATVVIKAVTALCFTAKGKKILNRRNYIALVPALVFCAAGYYLYEALLTQNFIAPAAGVVGYLTQWTFSSVLYLVMGKVLDRTNVKDGLVSAQKIR